MVRPEFKTCKSVSGASAPTQGVILQKRKQRKRKQQTASNGLSLQTHVLYFSKLGITGFHGTLIYHPQGEIPVIKFTTFPSLLYNAHSALFK